MNLKENVLIDKSIDFGARIVKLHRYLLWLFSVLLNKKERESL